MDDSRGVDLITCCFQVDSIKRRVVRVASFSCSLGVQIPRQFVAGRPGKPTRPERFAKRIRRPGYSAGVDSSTSDPKSSGCLSLYFCQIV